MIAPLYLRTKCERLAWEIMQANAPFMRWQEAIEEAAFWLAVTQLV